MNGRDTSYQGKINLQNHCPEADMATHCCNPTDGLNNGRGWFRELFDEEGKEKPVWNVQICTREYSALLGKRLGHKW